MRFKCVYLRNNFCMFFGSPTCPNGKKCVDAIKREREEKALKQLEIGVKSTEVYEGLGYPKPPAKEGLESEYLPILLEKHYYICDLYFRSNLTPFMITTRLDLTPTTKNVTMVLHYIKQYVVKRFR